MPRAPVPYSTSAAASTVQARRGGEPLDALARSHPGNGARVERINRLSDTSDEGMRRSAGLMANYVYRLGEVEDNHEAYVKRRRVVSASRIELLAREAALAGLVPPAPKSGRS